MIGLLGKLSPVLCHVGERLPHIRSGREFRCLETLCCVLPTSCYRGRQSGNPTFGRSVPFPTFRISVLLHASIGNLGHLCCEAYTAGMRSASTILPFAVAAI